MSVDARNEELRLVVKASGDKKFDVAVSATSTVLDLKQQLAEQSSVPAEQQRLIHSGRILKDPEELGSYGIKSGMILHLVKGAKPKRDTADPSAGASAAGSAAGGLHGAPPPSAMAAGQETGNPLSDLTGARYSGMANLPPASVFGPDGGQGPMPSMADLNTMMAENPELLDQAASFIAQSGSDEQSMLFQSMPAHARDEARALMSSPEMRALMSDPQRLCQFLQASLQIQQLLGRNGASPNAGLFGFPGNSGPEEGAASSNSSSENPMAALGLGSLGGFAGLSSAAADTDTRPPEERFATQLGQLNELGFFDFDRNVRALRRSGGNIEGAVEALLDGHV